MAAVYWRAMPLPVIVGVLLALSAPAALAGQTSPAPAGEKPQSERSCGGTSTRGSCATRRPSRRSSPPTPINTRRPASGGEAGRRSYPARSNRRREIPATAVSRSPPSASSRPTWPSPTDPMRLPAAAPFAACGPRWCSSVKRASAHRRHSQHGADRRRGPASAMKGLGTGFLLATLQVQRRGQRYHGGSVMNRNSFR